MRSISEPTTTAFVAQPRDDVEVVTIGDEVVLLDGWRSATVTNKAGASIWSTLGQAETIGAVAESLAREFGAPVEVVTNDVVDFVRQAAVSGLLKNAPRPEHPHGAGGQPPHLMAGDSAPSTQLWHTNGRPCSLADTLGRESLLVNWNPHCGFCARLVDRIAVLAEPLKAAGIPLAPIPSS